MSSMINGEFQKWNQLKELKRDTVVRTVKGEEYIFIELKQKYFIGIKDGISYEVSVRDFGSVIRHPDVDQREEYKTLKVGELFYVYDKSDSILYVFHSIDNTGCLVGINPVSRIKVRIDPVLYVGRVKDINTDIYIDVSKGKEK